MNMLDPARIAMFFTLPGAVELVEAFSAIPPGPVRDSIVAHAQALAAISAPRPQQIDYGTFNSSVTMRPFQAEAPPPEPMISWQGPKPPPLLNLVASSAEGQIVERALRGETPKAIADSLGVNIEVVYSVQARARREGRIEFPGDDRGKNVSKASPLMRKVNGVMAAPAKGPFWFEDPNSAIWDNPHLLPTRVDVNRRSFAFAGPTSTLTFRMMESTAKRNGKTLRQYVAQRWEVAQRVLAGEAPTRVAASMRLPEHFIYGVLTQVGYTATQAASDQQRPIVGHAPPGGERRL
ncbi:MAG TPA: hypothetical protein VGG68_00920 [Caulobacteraceae bacterium]|jgi:hypothetical protein